MSIPPPTAWPLTKVELAESSETTLRFTVRRPSEDEMKIPPPWPPVELPDTVVPTSLIFPPEL